MKIPIDGIVGARPNLMKMAPLARAIAEDRTFALRLIHTGQHYDAALSGAFFRELGLPEPAANLEAGSGPQGEQTGRILAAYERLLLRGSRPRGVLVVGDVNSTLACALAAAKLEIPVAHVEAGLRSRDRSMPEELNRILTDALSELLFVSEPGGLANLKEEGRPAERSWLVGNVMVDTLLQELPRAAESTVLSRLGVAGGRYAYLTLHRAGNVDDPRTLAGLMGAIARIADEVPVVFAVHPRTAGRLSELDLPPITGLIRTGPQGYHDNVRLIRDAEAVLTDSGGIQEEAAVLGVPCLTLRENTERPITVELGTNELVGRDPRKIFAGWRRVVSGRRKRAPGIPLWDGRAARRIVKHLKAAWGRA